MIKTFKLFHGRTRKGLDPATKGDFGPGLYCTDDHDTACYYATHLWNPGGFIYHVKATANWWNTFDLELARDVLRKHIEENFGQDWRGYFEEYSQFVGLTSGDPPGREVWDTLTLADPSSLGKPTQQWLTKRFGYTGIISNFSIGPGKIYLVFDPSQLHVVKIESVTQEDCRELVDRIRTP